MQDPFRTFNRSPEVIRLAEMMYVRYPLSLRQIEDFLFERGIDIWHETAWFRWNRFGSRRRSEIDATKLDSDTMVKYGQWAAQKDRTRCPFSDEVYWGAFYLTGVLELSSYQ